MVGGLDLTHIGEKQLLKNYHNFNLTFMSSVFIKISIFVQMTKMLDILGDYLNLKKIKFCRLDGSMQFMDRQENIDTFNKDPEHKVKLRRTLYITLHLFVGVPAFNKSRRFGNQLDSSRHLHHL